MILKKYSSSLRGGLTMCMPYRVRDERAAQLVTLVFDGEKFVHMVTKVSGTVSSRVTMVIGLMCPNHP